VLGLTLVILEGGAEFSHFLSEIFPVVGFLWSVDPGAGIHLDERARLELLFEFTFLSHGVFSPWELLLFYFLDFQEGGVEGWGNPLPSSVCSSCVLDGRG